MFKFLNQCLARFRFWKSVSSKTAVAPSSRFRESETLFQNRSCAKHWFKNLNILATVFCDKRQGYSDGRLPIYLWNPIWYLGKWPLSFSTRMNDAKDHSSLLSVLGLNATSTYDLYLPWIFGKFALIWGHFQNILTSRFRGRWGRRGQTTSKSKTTKILNENLLKLDEIQNLASATSKMTSWPQWPRKRLSGFFQKLYF